MRWSCVYGWVLGLCLTWIALPAGAAFVEVRGPDRVSVGEEFRLDVVFVLEEDADASLGRGLVTADVGLEIIGGQWLRVSPTHNEDPTCDIEYCGLLFGVNNGVREPDLVAYSGSALIPRETPGITKFAGDDLRMGYVVGLAGEAGLVEVSISADYPYLLQQGQEGVNILRSSPTYNDIVKTIIVPEPALLWMIILGTALLSLRRAL